MSENSQINLQICLVFQTPNELINACHSFEIDFILFENLYIE